MTLTLAAKTQDRAAEELKRMWPIFRTGPDDPIHLRAIWPKGVSSVTRPPVNHTFLPDHHPIVTDRQDAFTDAALRLNRDGYNIYTTLNPVSAAFTGGRAAVRDQDIACRRRLLIDIDRAGAATDPATDDEVADAEALAKAVATYLMGLGWPEPGAVASGNGLHLYYPLAIPNDDTSKHQVRALLRLLAEKFNNANVQIDTSVFNAGRITKVPGTLARKGFEQADRPYRYAEVIQCPTTW